MEQWAEIRLKVLTGQISKRAACKEYGIHWQTLEKMLAHTEPPGYRRNRSRTSKLDPFLPVIQQILKEDESSHRKQRHTAKRIFERLRDEHGYPGGQTLVAMAVRDLKQKSREVFLPLSHPPGEAQVDFGFADVHPVVTQGQNPTRTPYGKTSSVNRRTTEHEASASGPEKGSCQFQETAAMQIAKE